MWDVILICADHVAIVIFLQYFLFVYLLILGAFQCANGESIAPEWVCDFDPDCVNGDDEVNCTDASYEAAGMLKHI